MVFVVENSKMLDAFRHWALQISQMPSNPKFFFKAVQF
jgi:hypothetical protein